MKKRIFRKQMILIVIVFALAFTARYIYLIQISDTPFFEYPSGDAKAFFSRSQEILQGDLIGEEVSFHSSPPYPYFIAFIFWLSNKSFFVLGLVQILIGSLNCLLIFFLAKEVSRGKIIPAFIAGIMSALYGLFAFLDADMLMIFLTVVFVNSMLLLLIKFRKSRMIRFTFLAGACCGLAALDRTNILLFVPVAVWFIVNELSFKLNKWQWKPAILFMIGVLIMILPVTLRNYIVEKDLVLVSSNAGINLFIGNNPEAVGVFYLPAESGLSNYDLYASARQIAERETGNQLLPSQISFFWARKAGQFIITKPLQETALLWRKFLLLWNHYEIPNHLNFYFIRANFAPVLYIMFFGFWFIAPIAVVGIAWHWKKRPCPNKKLLIGFLITYSLSLMPFFITERYRLPIVSVLIVFASIMLIDIFSFIKKSAVKKLLIVGIGILTAAVFVNWPRMQFKNSRQRLILGSAYIKRALEDPQNRYDDFKKAIIELKWAIETEPFNAYAHYQLGRAYATIGHYSGSINELTLANQIDSKRTSALQALKVVNEKFNMVGDIVPVESIPKTPFEKAHFYETKKQYYNAEKIYREIIQTEPFHFQAWNDLGIMYYKGGEYEQALRIFKDGLRIMPDNVILLNNLAGTYYKIGDLKTARQLWERCLEIQSDNDELRNFLKTLQQ